MNLEQGVQRRQTQDVDGTAREFWRKAAVALRPSVRTGLLLTLAAAYLLPFVWILYRIGDDGTLIYGAQRVSEGAIPGRDFLEVMGPGSFYWLGLFFKLFGLGWPVTRLVVLFTGVATTGLLYAIARQVCRESVATLVLLFVLIVGLPLWPTVNHHWDSNLFAISALWCYLRLEKTGRWIWAIAAGTLVGITSCVMQPKGVLLLLALVSAGALRRLLPVASYEMRAGEMRAGEMRAGEMRASTLASARRLPTSAALWLLTVSFAAVGIGVVAAYWKAGALAGLYYANVTWPLSGYHDINASTYGRWLVSVAMTPASQAVGPERAIAGLLGTGLSLIPFLVIGILPILVMGSALACVFSADARRNWLGSPLIPLTLAGGAMWLSEIHRADVFHLVYGSPVLLIVLFASAQSMLNAPLRKAFMGSVAVGLITFGSLNFVTHLRVGHTVETRRGTVQSVSDDEALRFLCTSVKRREFVFVYPYYPAYYYLADVSNPTRFSILLYGYNTPEQFDEVIRNLEEKRVRYVVWDQKVYGDKLRAWFPAYQQPPEDKLRLEHYIQANYVPIAVKSNFKILERRPDDQGGKKP
jgi:hypothetical protein